MSIWSKLDLSLLFKTISFEFWGISYCSYQPIVGPQDILEMMTVIDKQCLIVFELHKFDHNKLSEIAYFLLMH